MGELVWDLAPPGHARLAEARALRHRPGGATANAALELARAGVEASVCAALGDDPLGRGLRARLAEAGVDIALVGLARVRTGLVFLEAPSAPGPRAVGYRDPAREVAALRAHVAALGGASGLVARARPGAVVLGTLAPADSAVALWAAIARAARRAGALVVVDVNARPRLWRDLARKEEALALLGLADLVKCSADDLATLAPGEGAAGARAALAGRLRRGATLVVTDGARAARALGPFGEVHVAPRRALASDAPGAGDAFVAGLVGALLAAQGEPASAARWARALTAAHARAGRWVARAGST
jgi:sugar/nucleoside kinase (ribokinase family)